MNMYHSYFAPFDNARCAAPYGEVDDDIHTYYSVDDIVPIQPFELAASGIY